MPIRLVLHAAKDAASWLGLPWTTGPAESTDDAEPSAGTPCRSPPKGSSERKALATQGIREAGTLGLMSPRKQPPDRQCDFCGRREGDGRTIVAGPRVYICNECVELAVEVLEKKGVPVQR